VTKHSGKCGNDAGETPRRYSGTVGLLEEANSVQSLLIQAARAHS